MGSYKSKLQDYNLEMIRKAGGRSVVASSLDEVLPILKEIDNDNI